MKKFILFFGIFMVSLSGISQPMNEPDLDGFKEMAMRKADEFSVYIAKIASKSTSLYDKELAIELALQLFIYDTVTIQISYCPSGSAPTIYSRTLDKYLRKLSMLNYESVTIEWVDVVMVNELKKGADGNYYGIISISQKFTAKKGDYIYSDVTRKHVAIVLKPYKKPNDIGEDVWTWEIYLSDVNIVEPCS